MMWKLRNPLSGTKYSSGGQVIKVYNFYRKVITIALWFENIKFNSTLNSLSACSSLLPGEVVWRLWVPFQLLPSKQPVVCRTLLADKSYQAFFQSNDRVVVSWHDHLDLHSTSSSGRNLVFPWHYRRVDTIRHWLYKL